MVGGLLLLDILFQGFFPVSNRLNKTYYSISNGMNIVMIMLHSYAEDHDDRMPNNLSDLSPNYSPPIEQLGFCYELSDQRYYCNWLYFPRPLLSHAPSKKVVLAAPWAVKEAPLSSPKRLVILFDGTHELLTEDDFQKRIIHELHEQPYGTATPR